jgi:hypothetical protein
METKVVQNLKLCTLFLISEIYIFAEHLFLHIHIDGIHIILILFYIKEMERFR